MATGSKQLAEVEIHPSLREVPIRKVTVPVEARIVTHDDPHSPGADRFRYLRLRLREARRQRPLQSVLITSALPQDGKSTVSLNLTTSLSDRGSARVLCIEADFHHPSLSETFRLEGHRGLGQCIEEGCDPVSALLQLDPLGWYFLPAGTFQSPPSDILHSEAVPRVLAQLRPYFDWIVIDAPPLLAVTDPLVLGQNADGVLLVVRAGQTPKDDVEEALTLLGEERTVGIVLNDASGLNEGYSRYQSYYHYRKR